MDKLPVGQLPDLLSSNNDDEIMVITNSEYNQLKKEKISDLITDFTSTNENNALTKGTDGKMFVTDFGNASNITEGTLPVSVLPDIPKDKLPDIEITDLPESGVSADTYAYPSSVTVNAQGQVTAIEEGTPSGANANTDLSNITEAGKEVIRENAGSGLEVCDIGMALYVDETKGLRRYLNGQIVDINTNTQAFLNRLKQITTLHPSLLCTEEEWQAAKTLSAFGQVGKFVYNYGSDGTTVVSVRLPSVVNIQGLIDLQNLGVTVAAGLPNITSRVESVTGRVTGAFSDGGRAGNIGAGTQVVTRWADLDLSTSNSIYGNSDTVQQEAIQYPYFIQIATGSETENNIINEIELNNPFSLFDSKYSDHELNNLSWLKSEGQWNAKAVYPTAYDKLLKVYNGTETVEGLSVKLSTEEYTDYDFVLNTADETFRLPLKNGMEGMFSGQAVVGNGMTVGLTSGDTLLGMVCAAGSVGYLEPRTGVYGSSVGQSNIGNVYNVSRTIGLTTDPTKSGLVVSGAGEVPDGWSLYYYVGETVQNANLIDAGRLGEQLADKVDMLQASGAGMPSDKYIDLTLGASGSSYTAPANGWIFVGGMSTAYSGYFNLKNTSAGSLEFSLQKPAASQGGGGYIPVHKGNTFTLSYNAYNIVIFRFIYAQGAQGGS